MRKLLSLFFACLGITAFAFMGYILVSYAFETADPVPAMLSSIEEHSSTPMPRMLLNGGLADFQNTCAMITLDSGYIEYVYYPLISNKQPEYTYIMFAAKLNGGLASLTTKMGYAVKNFKVLIKDNRFHSDENIPIGFQLLSDMDVYYLGRGSQLPQIDQSMIFRRYPGLNLSDIYVFQYGHTPPDFRYALFSGILSIFCFGINLFLHRSFHTTQSFPSQWGIGMRNPNNKNVL